MTTARIKEVHLPNQEPRYKVICGCGWTRTVFFPHQAVSDGEEHLIREHHGGTLTYDKF